MVEPELLARRDFVHADHVVAPARFHREARQPFMQAEHLAIELGRGLAALQPAKLAALRLRRAVGMAPGETRDRKGVVEGKSVAVLGELVGSCLINIKTKKHKNDSNIR